MMDFSLTILIWRNRLALRLIRWSIRLTSWGEVHDHLVEADKSQARYNAFMQDPRLGE
jgi:hypothetical protein